MWFGRPDSNAAYAAGMATREAFAACEGSRCRGLIAIETHFTVTCNIWWLAVSPGAHRRGAGRALVQHVADLARDRGCRRLVVETMSPRCKSPEYEATRRFYEAVGFAPLVEFEPSPGDFMMWMLRDL